MKLSSKSLISITVSIFISGVIFLAAVYYVMIDTVSMRENALLETEAHTLEKQIQHSLKVGSHVGGLLLSKWGSKVRDPKILPQVLREFGLNLGFITSKQSKTTNILLLDNEGKSKQIPLQLPAHLTQKTEGAFFFNGQIFIVSSQSIGEDVLYTGTLLQNFPFLVSNEDDVDFTWLPPSASVTSPLFAFEKKTKTHIYGKIAIRDISSAQYAPILVSLKRDMLSKIKERFFLVILAGLLTSVLLGFLLHHTFSRFCLKTIHSLVEQLRVMDQTNNSKAKIKVDSDDELGELARYTNKAFERIHQNYDFSQRLLSLSPSAIFTIDAQKRITSWNKKAEELTGYTAEEIVGKPCNTFSLLPCKDTCSLYESNTCKPVFNFNCVIVTKDGRKIQIQKNADLIRDDDGNIIGGIEEFEDITEKLKEKKEKELLQQQVYQTSKLASLGTLGAGIAHELNNPLSIVIGYADLLAGRLEESEQKDLLDVVGKIALNAERMKKIITHIKDFSRDSSKDEQTPELLVDIANSILVFINRQLTNRGIEIDLQIAQNLPRILVNKVKMQSVFQNLLLNARDELSDLNDWAEKKITLRIYMSDDQKHQVVEVIDTGRGIHKTYSIKSSSLSLQQSLKEREQA